MAAWLALIFGVLTCWLFVHNLILGAQLRRVRSEREAVTMPKDYDPSLPNHFMADSLGDPRVCTGAHNHPTKGHRKGRG